jgi:preprotein translocase subunit SecB
MKISPLQLEHSVLVEISLIAAKGTKEFCDQLNIQASPIFARHGNDPRKWKVTLEIKVSGTGDKPAPYEVKLVMLGWFIVADEFDDDKQLEIVGVNAPSILYSTAREIVAGLTARSINGLFLLPSVSFAGTRIVFSKETPRPKKRTASAKV